MVDILVSLTTGVDRLVQVVVPAILDKPANHLVTAYCKTVDASGAHEKIAEMVFFLYSRNPFHRQIVSVLLAFPYWMIPSFFHGRDSDALVALVASALHQMHPLLEKSHMASVADHMDLLHDNTLVPWPLAAVLALASAVALALADAEVFYDVSLVFHDDDVAFPEY